MAEEVEDKKEQEKPRPPKKKAPVKKTKTLKPKTEGAEEEKPKPRPPAKKKKVVKKVEAEEKEEEAAPEEKEEKKAPPTKKKVEKEEVKEEKEVPEEKEEAEEGEEEEEAEEEEEIEIVEEVETYKVKIKPDLSKEVKHKLVVRRGIKKKTPEFRRQEWFRYKKLGTSWRRPRGIQSKARKHKGYRVNVVSIGYGAPAEARNLHPSGFKEVLVHNTADLEKIDPKVQAARIGHSVGTRKRMAIEAKADELGIRVLNPRR
jgi:large subunit ribosomal protein L32e